MTSQEIVSALKEIRNEAGINAWCDMSLGAHRDEKPVRAVLYPFGLLKSDEMYVSVEAETFEGAIKLLRETWEARKDAHAAETVRKMAIAVIRLTDEFGQCTDAALRNEFDPGLVSRYANAACKKANEIAGKGPFKIQRARSANAA